MDKMNNGMLWYDNQTSKPIEVRLQQAVDYFIAKYGHPPLCCFVHPEMLAEPMQLTDSIKVIPNQRILKNHIWLEISGENS
ncbi:hypothetical protein [Pelolinea submarina]|uniref:Uncharacterized protein n=1 Tax=Pelolinea submarina TaxID=913107 RepID=A0A347ZNF3_9CHLR|nr:hypothetical protein [Pelolinea submarina]REG08436.1 hypothetical protein DFR64_1803 [Pelolinea submarina]BBB46834.1 hypothetical protein Pelsub_P0061 [Pelolinea submarina]